MAQHTSTGKIVLFYGVALAMLVFLLKYLEYRYLIHDLSVEVYLGVIAVFFTGLGIWAGFRLTIIKRIVRADETGNIISDEESRKRTGISKREQEVLALMASGLSNQEIADKLFVSLNTIKTHTANLFVKLDVSRRTQAIKKAKELRLIP
ncbi:MAG: response regulator transcription factor [Cyclobacteriaceae bacterium]|nr:response regulator transcription factor [Cyclobacteriaceae bacterium]